MRVLAMVFSLCVATTSFCQSSGGVEAFSQTPSSSGQGKTWFDAPRGKFVFPNGGGKEALDWNAGETRKFVFNPEISSALVAHNDENLPMPAAKGKPIPTEWPNLKKEPIPTDWPKLKKLPIENPQTTQTK